MNQLTILSGWNMYGKYHNIIRPCMSKTVEGSSKWPNIGLRKNLARWEFSAEMSPVWGRVFLTRSAIRAASQEVLSIIKINYQCYGQDKPNLRGLDSANAIVNATLYSSWSVTLSSTSDVESMILTSSVHSNLSLALINQHKQIFER